MTSQARGKRGFTLIECLVATLILSLGLVGVIGCLTVALLGNQKASQTQLATAVAQSTIEDMRSRGFGSITAEEFPESAPVEGLHEGTRRIAITEDYRGNPRLKHVQVEVSWRGMNGAAARVELESVVGNRAGHSGSG
jgi:prepilin-type N-terminal cleavage/methylation domain-containing protein